MKILFVDDEPRRMLVYVEELQASGFEVTFSSTAEDAVSEVRNEPAAFGLIVLDVSMPAEGDFAHLDTDDGLRTGMYLFDKMRSFSRDVPIVILTNVPDRRIASRFERERRCWFFRKPDILPYQFAEEVSRILSSVKAENVR